LVGVVRAVWRLLMAYEATPPPSVVQLPTPTPIPAFEADLQLVWDGTSFSVVNVSGGPLYLSDVRFESESGSVEMTRWQTEFLSAPLTAFPDGGCLQVWGLSVGALPDKPAGCAVRHAWIAIPDAELFWQGVARFSVVKSERVVAQCNVQTGGCGVSLVGSVEVAPVVTTTTTNAAPAPAVAASDANVRLLWDAQSLTVLNIGDRPVNLTDVLLESERGALSIYRWDTAFLTASLSGFPAGDCLQVWNANTPNQPKPPGCETRHAWVAVDFGSTVWVDVPRFTVYQRGVEQVTCEVSAGACEFRAR